MHGAVIPGYLFDAEQYDYSIFSRWEYNYTTKTYEYSGQSWEKTNIGPIHDNLIWVTFEAKDYGILYKPDSIISVQFIPKDNTKFDIVHAFFYIRSPYSNIVNGVLYPDNTFSGDYAIIYNNDNNTDKIIDNTNDNSNVENIINENLSGDYQDFANKLNYNPLENPFIHVIEFVLNGICNSTMGSGDIQLELPLFGEEFILDSSGFETPTNVLTIFISSMLSALYVYAFYKYGFHVYESLQDGNVNSVINSATSDSNINHM